MTPTNLQQILDTTDPVDLLRNSQIGAYVYPVVAAEFTNWRREQRAWRETAVLYDQSHHMVNLMLRGPGAIELITRTAINSTASFPVDMAKQYVPTTPAGYVIGDGILFHEAEDEFTFVGRAPAANWLRYQAEAGGFDVAVELDERSPMRPQGKQVTRKLWRFQVQGPNAWAVLEKVNGGPIEDVKFFRMGWMNVDGEAGAHAPPRDGRRAGARALGPVRDLRRSAGRDPRGRQGVRPRAGRLARILVEHARVGLDPVAAAGHLHRRGAPRVPRVAARERLRGRECARRQLRLGRHRGLLPQPVGARLRTHGEVRPRLHRPRGARAGRPEVAAQEGDARVEQRGHDRDLRVGLRPGGRGYQFFDIPNANYGSSNFDSVIDAGGNVVGLSMFTGYSANERHALSLATVDPEIELGHRASRHLG